MSQKNPFFSLPCGRLVVEKTNEIPSARAFVVYQKNNFQMSVGCGEIVIEIDFCKILSADGY